MIENKELPKEFVSIRQIWLKQIDRCTEAISHETMKNRQDERGENMGTASVIESILALQYTLVDYGEAAIRSDLRAWINDNPGSNDISRAKRKLEFIIDCLNKYGMLFESSPEGYSNTEMKSL